MKKAAFKTGVLACSLSFAFCAGLFAQPQEAGLSSLDKELFPSEFFPNISDVSEGELLLAGLRSLYPKRILSDLPETKTEEPEPPVVRDLGSNGRYIRVKHLAEALPVIEENLSLPLLVLDFRYLATDVASTLKLASLLTRQESIALSLAGNYPVPNLDPGTAVVRAKGAQLRRPDQTVFTLSNHKTGGPIEALLAQLKAEKEIISVGVRSSGETGAFRPFPGLDSFYLISGEIRPADGSSLLESGFLPQVEVATTPEEDKLGYAGLRDGVSLDDLVDARVEKLRFDETRLLRERAGGPGAEEEKEEEKARLPLDPILQRTLHIVKALQALGRIGA